MPFSHIFSWLYFKSIFVYAFGSKVLKIRIKYRKVTREYIPQGLFIFNSSIQLSKGICFLSSWHMFSLCLPKEILHQEPNLYVWHLACMICTPLTVILLICLPVKYPCFLQDISQIDISIQKVWVKRYSLEVFLKFWALAQKLSLWYLKLIFVYVYTHDLLLKPVKLNL